MVFFNPVIGGKATQPVEFTRVLHVQNNLLSCLYLIKHKGFEICINSHQMDFICDSRTLFCAPIGSSNCEFTNWISTRHHCCCHHNLADITKMHKEGLVTDMAFGSSAKRRYYLC